MRVKEIEGLNHLICDGFKLFKWNPIRGRFKLLENGPLHVLKNQVQLLLLPEHLKQPYDILMLEKLQHTDLSQHSFPHLER